MRVGIERHLQRLVFLRNELAIAIRSEQKREREVLVDFVDRVLAVVATNQRSWGWRPFCFERFFAHAAGKPVELRVEDVECQQSALRDMSGRGSQSLQLILYREHVLQRAKRNRDQGKPAVQAEVTHVASVK